MKKTIGRNKLKWLTDQGCVLIKEKPCEKNFFMEETIITTKDGEFIDLADLGDKADNANFIYEHRLTNLMSVDKAKGKPLDFTYSCHTVSIGFNEEEQKWYGWTHRGWYAFGIGFKVDKDDILLNVGDTKYPFEAKTLDDCLKLAITLAEQLD